MSLIIPFIVVVFLLVYLLIETTVALERLREEEAGEQIRRKEVVEQFW